MQISCKKKHNISSKRLKNANFFLQIARDRLPQKKNIKKSFPKFLYKKSEFLKNLLKIPKNIKKIPQSSFRRTQKKLVK